MDKNKIFDEKDERLIELRKETAKGIFNAFYGAGLMMMSHELLNRRRKCIAATYEAISKRLAEMHTNNTNKVLEEVKAVISENMDCGDSGLFFSRNNTSDKMTTIYKNGDVVVDICYDWGYFEVFGLFKGEEKELLGFYHKLKKEED